MREKNALSNVFNKLLLGTLVLGFTFSFSFADDTTPTDVSSSSAILIPVEAVKEKATTTEVKTEMVATSTEVKTLSTTTEETTE